jgi:hypothetical protein
MFVRCPGAGVSGTRAVVIRMRLRVLLQLDGQNVSPVDGAVVPLIGGVQGVPPMSVGVDQRAEDTRDGHDRKHHPKDDEGSYAHGGPVANDGGRHRPSRFGRTAGDPDRGFPKERAERLPEGAAYA